MTDLELLADQFHRAFHGDAWHGASIKELLQGITAKQAASHPIPGAHSIWEIVLHIGSWEKMFDGAVHGKPLLPWPSPAIKKLDWPRVPKPNAAAWKKTQADLYAAAKQLRRSIAGFNPHRLLGWTLAGPALARGGGRRGARQCRRGRRGRLRALSGLVRRILGSGPSLCARGRPLLVACVRSGATLPAERRVLAAAPAE